MYKFLHIANPLLRNIEDADEEKPNPFGLVNLDSLESHILETLKHVEKLQCYVKNVNVNLIL